MVPDGTAGHPDVYGRGAGLSCVELVLVWSRGLTESIIQGPLASKQNEHREWAIVPCDTHSLCSLSALNNPKETKKSKFHTSVPSKKTLNNFYQVLFRRIKNSY